MDPDRRIVGLDIASISTGWSVLTFNTKKSISFGIEDFGIVSASGPNILSRMGLMSQRIVDKMINISPDRIFVEDPLLASISNKTTTIRLAQLNYHTCQMLRIAGFEVVNVGVRKARALVLGKNPSRNAKIEVMKHYMVTHQDALKGRLPSKYDDVTDSICIADAGERIHRKSGR